MRRDPSLVPLSHQHHNALALCVLTDRSLAADASTENLGRLSRRIADRFEIELSNHFALEEEVLFPPLRDAGLEGEVAELMADHDLIESLVNTLRHGATARGLQEFTTLLRRHVRREENEVFEEAQKRLPRELLDSLGAELDARVVRVCL
jgi:iron-sulfur cluster repair protein YtfE (RIC family)